MSKYTLPPCPDCGGIKTNRYAVRCRGCYYKRPRSTSVRQCTYDACVERHYAKDLCHTHWYRRQRGFPMDGRRSHRRQATVDSHGYILVWSPGHPRVNKAGYVFQHRLVMERLIGRPLTAAENVHHINGQRDDNRPENLELWSKSQPAGQRVDDKVTWALELLSLYRPDLLAAPRLSLTA